ncbi:MAG TPA: hypothetical protein VD997_01945 [Phycisphaerales bacterium]|nr:hypothetical protein [Phycisphaerales bacterium]
MHTGIYGVLSALPPARAAQVAGELAGLPGPHPAPLSWATTQDILLKPCGDVLVRLTRDELDALAARWGVPADGPIDHAGLVARLVSYREARGYRG